jgi:hypothetical protein
VNYVVTGTYSGWYTIDYNNQTGWVFGQVITLSGPCQNLPAASPPAAPDPSVTEEVTGPTSTPTDGPSPTPTATATATDPGAPPPPTATATEQEAALPIAPVTGPHSFSIHRDNGGTFNGVLSYPQGNVEDRVNTSINLAQFGADSARTLDLRLTCSGTGSENVYFTRTSKNATRYRCGDTISFRYAHPNSSGTYWVFIESGGSAYVNYTLTATTRE